MKYSIRLLILPSFLFLFSCANNKITSTWRKPSFNAARYSKVLVMAFLSKESDWSFRESMEQHMVDDLKLQGYDAISSFKEYGPISFDNLTEEQALNKVNTRGIASIVTIVLLDESKERIYVPAHADGSIGGHDGYWWPYYTNAAGRMGRQGNYIIDTKYYWESNVYMGTSKELVFTIKTSSFDAPSNNMLSHQYGKKIVREMIRNKIF